MFPSLFANIIINKLLVHLNPKSVQAFAASLLRQYGVQLSSLCMSLLSFKLGTIFIKLAEDFKYFAE